jgi:hypothetical protein
MTKPKSCEGKKPYSTSRNWDPFTVNTLTDEKMGDFLRSYQNPEKPATIISARIIGC